MPGSFDLSSGTVALGSPATPVYVYRYSGGTFTTLYNVICTGIAERAGVNPPTATFRYLFGDAQRINLGWPGRIDDVWPIDASGPYVVSPDDRIVVAALNPDGTPVYLFDGFAQIPQADITPTSEHATFTAVGVAAREFDSPISGRTQRSGSLSGIQDTTGASDVPIDRPCRFNPSNRADGDVGGYTANRTPDNYDTDDGKAPAHPVFTEPGIQGRPTAQSPAYWTIADAIKYILAECNPDSTYTSYPAFSTFKDLFGTVSTDSVMTAGEVLTDPAVVRDYDASNKPWPEAVAELASYAGLVVRWDLQGGTNGLPQTYLRFYRRDMLSSSPVRPLYLDEPGNSLANGSLNNITALHLARDGNGIVNAWQVETGQRVVEASFWLAPLFQVDAADASDSAKETFTDETNRKYRWWGVDELGDGYWSTVQSKWITGTAFDFSQVFPADGSGNPTFVARYRPGLGHLVTTDANKKPIKATLEMAIGIASDGPVFASTTDQSTWFPIPLGWRLLRDRLGIEFTGKNPNDWKGSKDTKMNGGKINAVEWWASPPTKIAGVDTSGKPPVFRLTVAFQDDLRMPISHGKRAGSPTQYARWRVADARDHFQYTSIDPSSPNYTAQGGNGTDPYVVRDDTTAADNWARMLRSAHEMPALAGSVTLPGIAFGYEIGDRISTIVGRDIDLGQNADSASGESPTYPVVVAREFHLDGQQRTTIHLSDLRAERHHNAF